MSKYTITPLNLGTITRYKSVMAYNLEPGKKIDLPVFSWYLTDGVHKIIVDTGGITPDGVRYTPYTQTEDQIFVNALSKIGVKPTDIETVILTHLHWDHASNNTLFSNARFIVQKAELQYAVAPLPIHKKSYNLQDIFKTEYNVIDGDVKLLEGIELITTPGHSPGSQTVLVDTAGGAYALIGDLVNLSECWDRDPKVPNGIHTDLVASFDSFAKVDKAADIILPGHEPSILNHSKYPY